MVPGDLFHILTKGRLYFVFEILSLFISIAHCLLCVVEYFDRSLGYIPSVQIYCHEANLPALLSNYQQAIVLLLSNYQQVTVPKEAIVARTGLRSDIHFIIRERPRTNIRPCHCAGIPIDPAIVRAYQSIKPSHCAGIFKQYHPALLDQNKTACLLPGHT